MFYKMMLLLVLSWFLLACNSASVVESTPEAISAPQESVTLTPDVSELSQANGVIVLADISNDPVENITLFQPLANYLAVRLVDLRIGKSEIKIAPDLETMAEWLATGQADLYFDSLYPSMAVHERSGAQPILRHWKDGMAEYHTLIFTNADSGITSLEELKGQKVAFESNFSTSGYMLPLAYFLDQGFDIEEKNTLDAAVADDQIGYIFSQKDQNTVQWVISDQVAAGVIDNLTYFNEVPEETRRQFTILAETNPVSRQVVMVRPDLQPEVVDAIRTILLEMDENEEGRAVLASFQATLKFDEFPEGGQAALNRMRELYEFTQRQ